MSAVEPGARPVPPARVWPALLLLGFSSGLPQPLVDSTFATWLAKAGLTPPQLVQVGYVTLPYTLKILWAPLVDRFAPLGLGRRRGWLVVSQACVLLALLAMAGLDPGARLGLLILAAALASFAGATQDLVVNGYTCEALPPERLPAGAGLLVWGYRGAWLVSGGLALVAADRWGWRGAYLAMAVLLLPGLVGTLLAPEPARRAPPTSLRAALVEPLRGWRAQLGARRLLWLAAFALLYRLPDGLANLLAVPFQAELYDLTELGLVRGLFGLVGAAAGTGLAAWSIPRFGERRALLAFALLQGFSNLGYVGLDQHWWGGLGGLIGVLLVENLCGALAATAFVSHLMRYCTSASAATQYALLTTITLLGPHLLREPIARVQVSLGWSGYFLCTAAVALPIVLVRPLLSGAPGESEAARDTSA